ncbi:hypothetical protein FHV99_004589 [Ochrobactrum sp. P20RRXII]|nr:hypothetical protein [Ochrobactrum sp. P20RRXII]
MRRIVTEEGLFAIALLVFVLIIIKVLFGV